MTFNEFFPLYVEGADNRPAVLAHKRGNYTKWIAPMFGTRPLDSLRPVDIHMFVGRLRLGRLAPHTQNNILCLLRNILKTAQALEIIDTFPAIKKRKEVVLQSPRFLSVSECERLARHAGAEWAPMISFAHLTGLRIGELRALQWIHVKADSLDVRIATSGRGTEIGPTKGKPRTVPLCERAKETIQNLDRRSQFIFSRPFSDVRTPLPLSYKACDLAIKRAGRRCGLRDLHWHVLRHSFASHLALAGVSIQKIQQLLGHCEVSVTMKYAHLTPSALIDAVLTLD